MANRKTIGTLFGALGMVSFSLTLPATRAAVLHIHPAVLAFGRPLLAAIFAGMLLIATRQPFPDRRYWGSFVLIIIGLVIGVPLTFAWGMDALPSTHGAITLGLLPIATALVGAMRAGERPSKRFWIASAIGGATVLAWAWINGAGHIQAGDTILLLSVAASALGYAEGARVARDMSGWEVTSWAIVLGAPLHIIPFALAWRAHPPTAVPFSSWAAFAYIILVSQWLGMFAWLKGLSTGGIARIGQIQLLQPFCTFAFAAAFLHETVTLAMLIAAGIVVASVAVARNAPIVSHHSYSGEEPAPDAAD
jgi:drug/metabolite transporter (DMT)-like permease